MRGIWRRTTARRLLARPRPHWTTVLDLDALAKAENANWVWKGADCDWPPPRRAAWSALSDGGEDADTVREFDLTKSDFVDGGFVLPRGKQTVGLGRRRHPAGRRANGARAKLTTSGYPFIVKRLQARPAALAARSRSSAASPAMSACDASVLHDGEATRRVLIIRGVDFFESEYYLVTAAGARKLALPLEAQIDDAGRRPVLFTFDEDWTVNGTAFPQGSLVALDLAAATADPRAPQAVAGLSRRARASRSTTVAARRTPSGRDDSTTTCRGRAFVYTPTADGGWSKRRSPLPDNASIGTRGRPIRTANSAFLSVDQLPDPDDRSGWPTPRDGRLAQIKALPAAVRRLEGRRRAVRSDVQGRHEDSLLRRASQGR